MMMCIAKPRVLLACAALICILVLSHTVFVSAEPVTFQFIDADYKDIFQTLGEVAGFNVIVDHSVSGKGSFRFHEIELAEALEMVAQVSDTDYFIKNNTLLVASKERLAEMQANQLCYLHPDYITAQELYTALAMVIPPENIYVNADSNLIIFYGNAQQQAMAQAILDKLDLPKQTNEQSTPVLEAGPDERIKVYRLNYADPAVVSGMIQLIVPSEQIRVDNETKSIMVKGTDKQIAEIDKFLADYDQPLPQVLLEVWIHEISDDASGVFGLNWNGTLPGARVGNSLAEDLFHMELDWEPWQIIMALEALEKEGKAKVLASPKIAVLSGEEATIFVGDQIPIVLTDTEGRQQMQFLESGINLSVRPRISDDGFVTIDVSPEVSLFIYTNDGTYPQIRTREANTTVRVKDGQPVLIGGLIQEQSSETISKVPVLGNLPIFGRLFQKTNSTKERTEMNIILIPRIVDGTEGLVSGSTLFSGAL